MRGIAGATRGRYGMTHDHSESHHARAGAHGDAAEAQDQEGRSSASGPGGAAGLDHDRSGAQVGDGRVPLDAEVVDPDFEQQVGHSVLAFARSGPLPGYSEFRGYESVVSGAGDRILKIAELSAAASADATYANAEATRAEADATRAGAESVREDAAAIRRGQLIFGGIAVLCTAAGTILALTGQGLFSVPPFVCGLLSGCGVLIRPVNGSRWRFPTSED